MRRIGKRRHLVFGIFLIVCALFMCCSAIIHGDSALAEPRVALLFVSRGEMPLEPIWRRFLTGVEGFRPPKLSKREWEDMMEVQRVNEVQRRLQEAGSFTANDIVRRSNCVDNDGILV
jgi:hypothetical protein